MAKKSFVLQDLLEQLSHVALQVSLHPALFLQPTATVAQEAHTWWINDWTAFTVDLSRSLRTFPPHASKGSFEWKYRLAKLFHLVFRRKISLHSLVQDSRSDEY